MIYLGPATQNSKACFTAARDTERFEKDPPRKTKELNYLFGNGGPDYSYAYDLTSDILSRSWFTRSWTFQELVVSKRPWVCCGPTCIPWTQLCIYILGAYRWNPRSGSDGYARDQYLMTLSNAEGLFSEHVVDRLSLEYAITEYYPIKWDKELGRLRATGKCMQNLDKARQLYHAKGNKLSGKIRLLQEKFTLSSLLEHRRGFAASDPRDVVFSLYGIIDESYPSQQCVPVDYERATPEIFTDVAAGILMSAPALSLGDSERSYGYIRRSRRTMENLVDRYSIFSHVNNNSMPTVPGLPSWVPDWSSPRSYQRSIRNSIHEYFPAIYWTSSLPQVSCDRRVYREDKVVVCRGSNAMDQIIALSDVMLSHSDTGTQTDKNATMPSWKIMHLEYDFANFFREPTPSIMYKDLQRIFSTGPIQWSEQHLKVIPDYQIIPMLCYRAECLWGRRIAMTASGGLALVPGDSQEGDLVCDFMGSYLPFVVRQVEASQKTLSPGDEQIVKDFEGSVSGIVRGVLVGECWKDVDMFLGARMKRSEEMTANANVGFALE